MTSEGEESSEEETDEEDIPRTKTFSEMEETEELVGPGSDTKEETFRIVIAAK